MGVGSTLRIFQRRRRTSQEYIIIWWGAYLPALRQLRAQRAVAAPHAVDPAALLQVARPAALWPVTPGRPADRRFALHTR